MGLFLLVLPRLARRSAYVFPLSTYVIHAVNENHFKLGTWVVIKK